jgi:hypothetical protein
VLSVSRGNLSSSAQEKTPNFADIWKKLIDFPGLLAKIGIP